MVENEEWETASETSLEERDKKKAPSRERQQKANISTGKAGRGGWTDGRGRGARAGNMGRGIGNNQENYNRETTPELPDHYGKPLRTSGRNSTPKGL